MSKTFSFILFTVLMSLQSSFAGPRTFQLCKDDMQEIGVHYIIHEITENVSKATAALCSVREVVKKPEEFKHSLWTALRPHRIITRQETKKGMGDAQIIWYRCNVDDCNLPSEWQTPEYKLQVLRDQLQASLNTLAVTARALEDSEALVRGLQEQLRLLTEQRTENETVLSQARENLREACDRIETIRENARQELNQRLIELSNTHGQELRTHRELIIALCNRMGLSVPQGFGLD